MADEVTAKMIAANVACKLFYYNAAHLTAVKKGVREHVKITSNTLRELLLGAGLEEARTSGKWLLFIEPWFREHCNGRYERRKSFDVGLVFLFTWGMLGTVELTPQHIRDLFGLPPPAVQHDPQEAEACVNVLARHRWVMSC
jgi:hypothetical protein